MGADRDANGRERAGERARCDPARVAWSCVSAEPLYVEADTTRLAQVFSNLLNNSAKFSDSQSIITIRAAQDGAYATVRVEDRGIGIEPDLLERVFDLFERADRSCGTAPCGPRDGSHARQASG